MDLNEKKLTAKARKSLSSSDFVFPGTRKFPINDRNHARNALARAAHKGGSVEAKVRAAVHHRYPDIGESIVDCLIPLLPRNEWL